MTVTDKNTPMEKTPHKQVTSSYPMPIQLAKQYIHTANKANENTLEACT
jgi:hypothetical protein